MKLFDNQTPETPISWWDRQVSDESLAHMANGQCPGVAEIAKAILHRRGRADLIASETKDEPDGSK
jgi:hypothetical protein